VTSSGKIHKIKNTGNFETDNPTGLKFEVWILACCRSTVLNVIKIISKQKFPKYRFYDMYISTKNWI